MTRELSVVIPHYGDPGPTRALAAQLLAGSVCPHQVIVSDDCSPVPFQAMDGVLVVRRESNGGFGAAVNHGAAHATGELLLILNSDLSIAPKFLAELLVAAEPWLPAVVGPRLVDPRGEVDYTARSFPRIGTSVAAWLTPLATLRHRPIWHTLVGHDVAAVQGDRTAVVDWVVGAALLLPRQAFEAIGGFDERFFMNSEEVDLQRRLRDRGVPTVYVPEVVATHVGGGSSDPRKRRVWLVEGEFRYAAKWGNPALLGAALAAATAMNFAWNLVRRVAGRPVAPLATAKNEVRLLRRGRRIS